MLWGSDWGDPSHGCGMLGNAAGVKVPKIAPGIYFPSLLEPRRRAERALAAVICEAPPGTVGDGNEPGPEPPGTFPTGYFESRDLIAEWFAA
jgi:hypothetical protein